MTNPSLKIDINLAVYEARLRSEIASDLSALELILNSFDSPGRNKKFIIKQNITLAEISIPPDEFIKRREINKCFKSILGSVQDYIDNLIGLLRLKDEKINIPKGTSHSELLKLVNDLLNKKILEASTDRSLNVPKKLPMVLDKSDHEIYKESLQSYFDVRNGLEHHKGIAKSTRVLKYRRIDRAVNDDDQVILKIFTDEIRYDQGGELIITKEQLDSLSLSLLILIIPAIQQNVALKINPQLQL